MEDDHMDIAERTRGELGDDSGGLSPALRVGHQHEMFEARRVARLGVAAGSHSGPGVSGQG